MIDKDVEGVGGVVQKVLIDHLPLDGEKHEFNAQIIHAEDGPAYLKFGPHRTLKVWVLAEPAFTKGFGFIRENREKYFYQAFGTGQPIPSTAVYVTTVKDNPFIWHIFEVSER